MKKDIHKHTLNLRTGDWDYIESVFYPQGVATSTVIRTIVSNYVDGLKSKENKPNLELDAEL